MVLPFKKAVRVLVYGQRTGCNYLMGLDFLFFLLRVDIRNGLSGLVLDPGPLFSSGCAM